MRKFLFLQLMNKNNHFLHLKTRLLRVFFYQLYHQFSWMYDLVAALVSLGMWKDWVATVVPQLKGPRVLELGHGPGHLQMRLQKNGIQVFGIDESPNMGKLAANRIRKTGKNANLTRGYAQSIPFAKHSFHQVVATFPSEFITDPGTLVESYRVLVPGGTLIVLPFAWITGKSIFERAAAWLFLVTGQSPQWENQMLTPFHKAGFKPQLERVTDNSWSLSIIIAEKF